jgi:hypothetical protein
VKHTYLYVLPPGKTWLWNAARRGATDLTGSPDEDAPQEDWTHYIRLSDHLGHLRDLLHKEIEDQPRVCIGRHYVIPGSLCGVAQERARAADLTVHRITRALWDAPRFEGAVFDTVRGELERNAGCEHDRDWREIRRFLIEYKGSPERTVRLVPVWM